MLNESREVISNHVRTGLLIKMNLVIRDIADQIAKRDTFYRDRHPERKAGVILGSTDWGGE